MDTNTQNNPFTLHIAMNEVNLDQFLATIYIIKTTRSNHQILKPTIITFIEVRIVDGVYCQVSRHDKV